ncbi:hypothetical protein ACFORL_09730 [Legionella dresdenensis]|uniref:Uncharacterized protein n=1 Tax=Legionella dresdenensis TaxID=450200 RepID=A0ABV8CG74_9GAMM
MLRKIGLGLLCAGALLATDTAVARVHELAPRMTLKYTLEPGQPEVLTNFTLWTINAECTINTEDDADIIHVRALNRSGEIDNIKLKTNEELDVLVRNNQVLKLKAESAAKVELVNNGEHVLVATCKTA